MGCAQSVPQVNDPMKQQEMMMAQQQQQYAQAYAQQQMQGQQMQGQQMTGQSIPGLDPYAQQAPAYNTQAPGTRVGEASTPQLNEKTIAIGIDFGTARSGYAFALGTDPVVQLQYTWPGELIRQAKTLTALLYDTTTWRPIAWGMEAYKQYRSVAPKDIQKYAFMEGFKLLLSESAEADFVDPLPEGCPHSNVAVIGHFLAFLKDYLMEQLRRTYGGKFLTTHTIKYCFTIPAGWSEEAKFNMRQAAMLAGIIPNQDSQDMTLIYEPEAAALTACSQANMTVEVGEVFLIVDAGGGTVDFTMHVVDNHLGNKVLSEATYRACLLQGSKKLDSNFEDFMAQLVGDDLYERWCTDHPGDHLQLVNNVWEELKNSFTGTTSQGTSVIRLPSSLVKAMPESVHQQVAEFSGYDDQLRLLDSEVAGIFDPAVNNILEVVQQMVTRANLRPDRLLLVGGFGSSAYLQLKLENRFGNSMGDLLYPPYGYAAVVEGAVRHLQKPATIFKRVSTLTYGVRVFLNWSREMPESYKQWDTYYKAYVTDKAFLVAVRKGEAVEVAKEFKHRVTPSHASAVKQEVRVELYSSDELNPTFVSEHMIPVETIVLPLDMTRVMHEDAYHIDLYFKFGAAEIEVTAQDTIENRTIKRRLEFAAHESAKGGVVLG